MDLQVQSSQEVCEVDFSSVKPLVQSVLDLESTFCSELNIYFVSEEQICELHQDFFDDPSPTDCISIQVDPPGTPFCLLGEIFISPKAAQAAIESYQTTLQEELSLYLVHGLLHLLGYDDLEDQDRAKMRLAEKRHMDYLKKHSLLLKV